MAWKTRRRPLTTISATGCEESSNDARYQSSTTSRRTGPRMTHQKSRASAWWTWSTLKTYSRRKIRSSITKAWRYLTRRCSRTTRCKKKASLANTLALLASSRWASRATKASFPLRRSEKLERQVRRKNILHLRVKFVKMCCSGRSNNRSVYVFMKQMRWRRHQSLTISKLSSRKTRSMALPSRWRNATTSRSWIGFLAVSARRLSCLRWSKKTWNSRSTC